MIVAMMVQTTREALLLLGSGNSQYTVLDRRKQALAYSGKACATRYQTLAAITSYPPNEACLQFLPSTLSAESIYEDWPPTYAKLINESADIIIPQPKTCKLHPSLFVHVGGDRLGGLTYIEIVKMEWNYDIEQPEEALKRLGRESITTVKKCEAEILVDTLEQLARTT